MLPSHWIIARTCRCSHPSYRRELDSVAQWQLINALYAIHEPMNIASEDHGAPRISPSRFRRLGGGTSSFALQDISRDNLSLVAVPGDVRRPFGISSAGSRRVGVRIDLHPADVIKR